MEILGFFLIIAVAGLTAAVLIWAQTRNRQRAETPLLLIQQQLDALRNDFVKTLGESRERIDTRLDKAGEVFRGMENRMGKMEEVSRRMLEIGKDISGLQQILKAPKLRGNFGEELLGDLLAQMLPQETYSLQHGFQNGERVDAVIKTAQGLVPIDAKFPLENFQQVMLAGNDEDRKAARKKFMTDVRKHIDDIASKYIVPSEGTFEFALMYIPAENVYYEIITKDLNAGEEKSIVFHALKKKVIPVSPNTFYAYLQTILLGLRGMQVEKKSAEILKELTRFRAELLHFRSEFGVVGKHLKDAVNSFAKSDKRLVRMEDRLQVVEAPALSAGGAVPAAALSKEDPKVLAAPANDDPGVPGDAGV